MWPMLYPIMMIVLSNVMYNICQKSTPGNVNPFAALTVTYGIAAAVSFVLLMVTTKGKYSAAEFTKINWAPWYWAW